MRKLFSNCKWIEGYSRDAIYDLQYSRIHFVPKGLKMYLDGNLAGSSENYDFSEVIQGYEWFLQENNLINLHFTDENEFPEYTIEYESNQFIQNLIVIEEQILFDVAELCDLIQNQSLVLIIKRKLNGPELIALLERLENTKRLIQIRVILNSPEVGDDIGSIVKTSSKISDLILMGMNEDSVTTLHKTTIVKRMNAGFLGFNQLNALDNMQVNTKLFKESQSLNSYYNQLLFIDEDGSIRNAPEDRKNFGFISELEQLSDILTIIKSDRFKELWSISKSVIDVCKICEYRHVCVDNRLPVKRKSDEWYFESECTFNPYITKWSHEEGYHTLIECGVISDGEGFSIDHDKIALVNYELWGDE